MDALLGNLNLLLGLRNVYINGVSVQRYRDISISIDRGQSISILGPNGIGKSLLIRTVLGLEKSDGEVLRLGTSSSYMPQDYLSSLFPWCSIQENIELAKRYTNSLLKALDWFDYLPDKIDPSSTISTLSGGEAQLVCLIRSLYSFPSFLVLDEPTAHLDVENKHLAWSMLLDFQKANSDGVTIIVTHDLDEAILLSDQIWVLGGAPVEVRDRFSIRFPDNRDLSTLITPLFDQYRRQTYVALKTAFEKQNWDG